MKRALLVSALALIPALTAPGLAQSSTAFGLQITPRGGQNLNLATGTTDLPQGGTVRDNSAGIKVVAGFISIKTGESLSATSAVVTTRQGGTLRAQQITYNQKAGLVTATGTLNYSDNRVKNLSAQTIYVSTRSGAVTAVGMSAPAPRRPPPRRWWRCPPSRPSCCAARPRSTRSARRSAARASCSIW